MSMIEALTEYGQTLVAEGFQVWLTKVPSRQGGYLQYRDPETGCWGSLQYSDSEGWQHLMPLVRSREAGSSMYIEHPLPPFTVEAARQCAQPTNANSVVGRRQNAKESTWLSASAIAL